VGPKSGQQQKTDQNVGQCIRRSVPSLRVCNLVNAPRSSSKQIESFQKEGEVVNHLIRICVQTAFCRGKLKTSWRLTCSETIQAQTIDDLDVLEDVADFYVGSCEMYLVR